MGGREGKIHYEERNFDYRGKIDENESKIEECKVTKPQPGP